MNTTGLKQWQAQFKRYLFSGTNEEQLAHATADPTGIGAVTRLDVYRNAYYSRLQEALAHDFPVLLAVTGDEIFGQKMAKFLQACPPTSPSLRQLGQPLPDWLRQRDEHALADLVALEWAVLDAFDAANAVPLAAEDLAVILPGQWNQLRFELQPALSLVRTRSNALAIWRTYQQHQPLPPIQSSAARNLAVWRSPGGPAMRALSAQAYLVLDSMGRGCTFGDICVRLAGQGPVEDVPAVAAQHLLEFISSGWVTAASETTPSTKA